MVRRLSLDIEETLHKRVEWVVFELNDEQSWARMRHEPEAIMLGLFQQGALAGNTREEAFFVNIGREGVTLGDIDNGIVSIEIGFAPLVPAQFVIVRIRQETGQENQ
jgi:uncharacterized protein